MQKLYRGCIRDREEPDKDKMVKKPIKKKGIKHGLGSTIRNEKGY